jgi:ATP-dependent Clp protease ATP-binding subunit ClpC
MVDKFTERARHVIFFARVEASLLGSPVINTELLLIGILREYPRVFADLGGDPTLTKSVEDETRNQIVRGKRIPKAIDMPLSDAARQVLLYAVDEAARLNHPKVTVHHLMVGILRDENSLATQILLQSGLNLNKASEKLAELGSLEEEYAPPPWDMGLEDMP